MAGFKDLALSATGDLILGPDGDFLFVTGTEALQQQVTFRLKTQRGDYKFYPQGGANLASLVGLPNSNETSILGENLITYALTYDGFIKTEDLTVTGYPIDPQTIGFLIEIGSAAGEITLQMSLDLQEGTLL